MLMVECCSHTRIYLPSSEFGIVDQEDIQMLGPPLPRTKVALPSLQPPNQYRPDDCTQTLEVQLCLPQ